jgi:hypothetical protein
MKDKTFEKLLDRLSRIIEAGAKKNLSGGGRERLAAKINEVGTIYDGTRYWTAEHSRPGLNPNLHEIREPLGRVIELLEHEGNWHAVLAALGAAETKATVERAVERHDDLLRDLRKIATAVPEAPPPRGRGKPPVTKDLRALGDELASFWERETRGRFKQSWMNVNGKKQPYTDKSGTAFVYEAVKFIDPKRLGELPEVTEKIVRDRRARERRVSAKSRTTRK